MSATEFLDERRGVANACVDFDQRQTHTHNTQQCARGRAGTLRKPTYLRASGARSRGNARESLMYGGFFDFNKARPGKRGIAPPGVEENLLAVSRGL